MGFDGWQATLHLGIRLSMMPASMKQLTALLGPSEDDCTDPISPGVMTIISVGTFTTDSSHRPSADSYVSVARRRPRNHHAPLVQGGGPLH